MIFKVKTSKTLSKIIFYRIISCTTPPTPLFCSLSLTHPAVAYEAVMKACRKKSACVDKHSFSFPSHSYTYTRNHKHTERKTRGWVRLFLCLRCINTHPAEARRVTEPLPGYMEGQSVLSYCTVQPLSTAAPYRVHKAWWMAYHHLPLWWLLNAVTLRQAHAREVRHTKTDRQVKPGHKNKKQTQKGQMTKWC